MSLIGLITTCSGGERSASCEIWNACSINCKLNGLALHAASFLLWLFDCAKSVKLCTGPARTSWDYRVKYITEQTHWISCKLSRRRTIADIQRWSLSQFNFEWDCNTVLLTAHANHTRLKCIIIDSYCLRSITITRIFLSSMVNWASILSVTMVNSACRVFSYDLIYSQFPLTDRLYATAWRLYKI